LATLSNCGDLRGVNAFDGRASRGFQSNESTSWYELPGDPYVVSDGNNLFGVGNTGLYGLETVALLDKATGQPAPALSKQTVAGISQQDFWIGTFGLGTSPGKFSSGAVVPSYLAAMKNRSMIPSLSYGYTAGQSYASPPIPGSLILGGYDEARISSDPSPISLPINITAPQSLQIGVQSITTSNALGGSGWQLLSKPLVANIDSAVSQLWLPSDACDIFVKAFGLTYTGDSNYYYVNATIHQQLKLNNPSLTFAVGTIGGDTLNVEFPYSAFDHNLTQPFSQTPIPYFPLRQAADESQYTLGRVFLQEAAMIVNWENATLTIGQAVSQNSTTRIQPILPPSQSATSPNAPPAATSAPPAHQKGLATGAIAAIVVIMIALIAAGTGFWLFRRRRQRRAAKPHNDSGAVEAAPEVHVETAHEYYPPEKEDDGRAQYNPWVQVDSAATAERPGIHARSTSELDSTHQIHEMEGFGHERELMGIPVFELAGHVGSELDVSEDTVNELAPAKRKMRSRPSSPRERSDSDSSTPMLGDRGPFATPLAERPPPIRQETQDTFVSARSSDVPFSSVRSSELLSLRDSGPPLLTPILTPRASGDLRGSTDAPADELIPEDQAQTVQEVAVAVPVTPVRGRDVRLSTVRTNETFGVRSSGFHVLNPTTGIESRNSMEMPRDVPGSSTDAKSQHSWKKGDDDAHPS
ncbi:hypothetical protein LTR53_017695, partial [Teratosphaeriaceae sp. CCFEE 6253]